VKILSSGSLKMGGQPPPHLELKEGSSWTTYHHSRKLSGPEGLIEPHVVYGDA
jgi:hypothetical protein